MTKEAGLRVRSARAVAYALLGLSMLWTTAHAQALRVTAANSSNGSIYDVNFSGTGGSIAPLNTDQSAHVSIRSLVYVANTVNGTIDLLAADSARGQILLYPSGVGVSQIVWSSEQGAGPVYPDGMSVDAAGNLYVVSSGTGNPKPAQLWVLPRNDPSRPGGYGLPRLLDSDFGGITVNLLVETLVVRGAGTAAGLGDLLVLASDPAIVLRYSSASIAAVLSGAGEINPSATLVTTSQFPPRAVPGGMDFWPLDNSLLITTGDGNILRYSVAGSRLADFASGLGNGKYKIRTGWQSGEAFAFVANNNGGNIQKFRDDGGTNPPVAIITSGVQSPQGLTTTNMASASLADCLDSNGGCDLLGGVIKHDIDIQNGQTLTGYIIEDICVVQKDPRVNADGTFTKASLSVGSVCAGFGNTVIPDFLYGAAGEWGSGFALVKSASGTPTTKGALVVSEARIENVLSPLPCGPQTVLAWAPTAGEGVIAEGNAMAELTSGCYNPSIGLSRDRSLWAIGLTLKTSALTGGLTAFAASKYGLLTTTISAASIQTAFRRKLEKCISTSRGQFDRGLYGNAAGQLLTCDALVVQNEAQFAATANNPNPSGDIRARLANLYLTINARILSNAPASSWPPSS